MYEYAVTFGKFLAALYGKKKEPTMFSFDKAVMVIYSVALGAMMVAMC